MSRAFPRCPVCGELVRPGRPQTIVPYKAHGLPAPDYAHLDGEPLCPVIGEHGYQPAEPIHEVCRPALVFIHDTTHPDAHELIVFPARHLPTHQPGDVVPHDRSRTNVDPQLQAGALRWNPRTGLIDLIYTQPRWRRQGVATALFHTATRLHHVRTGRHLKIPDNRTALGEAFAHSLHTPLPVLRTLALPMTPATDAEGFEDQLLPDRHIVEWLIQRFDRTLVLAACEPTAESAQRLINTQASSPDP